MTCHVDGCGAEREPLFVACAAHLESDATCHVDGCEEPAADRFLGCAGHILPDASGRSCPHTPLLYGAAERKRKAELKEKLRAEMDAQVDDEPIGAFELDVLAKIMGLDDDDDEGEFARVVAASRARRNTCRLERDVDCEKCERYKCSRCERLIAWEHGCVDDMTGVCDDCWLFLSDCWGEDQDKSIELFDVVALSAAWEPTPGSWEYEPDLEIRITPHMAGKVVGLEVSAHEIGHPHWRNPTRWIGQCALRGDFQVIDVEIGGRRQFRQAEGRHGGKLAFASLAFKHTMNAEPGSDYELDEIRAGEDITLTIQCAQPLCAFRLRAWIKHDEQ